MSVDNVDVYENFSLGGEEAMPVRVAAGDYKRGEILGRVGNVYGKLNIENAVPAAIMPFDLKITAESVKSVYVSGNFNESRLDFGGKDVETVKTALRDGGIFVRKWSAENNE